MGRPDPKLLRPDLDVPTDTDCPLELDRVPAQPVLVLGEESLTSVSLPFRRQIRSNSTSAGRGLPNRPVNCLPSSVSTCWGSRTPASPARTRYTPPARNINGYDASQLQWATYWGDPTRARRVRG